MDSNQQDPNTIDINQLGAEFNGIMEHWGISEGAPGQEGEVPPQAGDMEFSGSPPDGDFDSDDGQLSQDPAAGPMGDVKDRSDALLGQAVQQLQDDANEIRIQSESEKAALQAEKFAGDILNKVDPVTGLPAAVGPEDLAGAFIESVNSVKSRTESVKKDLPSKDELAKYARLLPKKKPDGVTQIPDQLKPAAIQMLAQGFPSLNELGIARDMNDRMVYARSVLANEELRSDIRAKLIDDALKTGRILPEALSRTWYASQGLQLPLPPEPGGGMNG